MSLFFSDFSRIRFFVGQQPALPRRQLVEIHDLHGRDDGDKITLYSTPEGAANVKGDDYGAIGDGITDDTDAIQAALNSTAGEVVFPPGTYKTTRTLTLRSNKTLSCHCPESALISYTGTGFALEVNSSGATIPGSTYVSRVALLNLSFTAPLGSGVYWGTSINPVININNVYCRNMAGRAMDFGQSIYFVTMDTCGFQNTRGVRCLEYCDNFGVLNCKFGGNTDYDLDIKTTTFLVDNCDFEGNVATHGNKANIITRASTIESGYAGIRANNRFGPEGVTAPCLHDIEVVNVGTSNKALQGLKIIGNQHFSSVSGTKKIAPILLDSAIGGFEFNGTTNGLYTSGKDIVTSAAANLYVNSPLADSYVEDITLVEDSAKGTFQYRAKPDLINYRRAKCGEAIPTALTVVWIAAYSAPSARGLGAIYTSINYPWETRFACGVSLYAHASQDVVQFAEEGSIITTALNTGGSTSNDPVYMGAAGTLSLTPHPDYVKVVGRVVSLETNGRVRLDFREPVRYTAMPGGGRFQVGDFAPKAVPVEAGAAASKYIVSGWRRLTDSNTTVIVGGAFNGATGSNNVLNTDWFEVRELTGN